VDAILAIQSDDPAGAARAVRELTAWWNARTGARFSRVMPAVCASRVIKKLAFTVNEELFSEDAERSLFSALLQAEKQPRPSGSVDGFLNAFSPMIPQSMNSSIKCW